jgi:inhibitor of KinA
MFLEIIKVLSERSILVYFGDAINEETHEKIQLAVQHLTEQQIEGITEIVCGYTNICVHYEPLIIKKSVQGFVGNSISEKVITFLQHTLQGDHSFSSEERRIVEIPVIYGGESGPDLAYVAERNNLTPQEVIDIHTGGDYLVYMLGFAPGFPFLGGLDPRIATPRRQTPRLKIEAGSVGIAGEQTGVYPLATPGGWQIIGRTAVDLFLPNETPPTYLRAGDRIRFVAVKEEAK